MPTWMSQRLAPYGASIFDHIGRLAVQNGCVNLGQGFPDFDAPEAIKEAAQRAIRDGHNQYAPLAGVPELTRAIAEKFAEESGLTVNPASEITVLNGATEAMFAAISAFCEPGDEWILFAPIYDTYLPIIQMCGGKAVVVPLEAPDFRFDPERLRSAFSKRTKGIIVNTPHNPTGRVFDQEELEIIRDGCVANDAIAITDEVYEHLVWDNHRHHFLAALDGMRERCVTISSSAKTFSLTGWKIGYAIAPPEATEAIRRLHQFACFAVATPFQWGIAAAIKQRARLIPELVAELNQKRQLLSDGLRDIGFRVFEPQGSFFICADFSAFSDKDDVAFAESLITGEVGVATIPISVFYPPECEAPRQFVRFCFAKRDETLALSLEKLSLLKRMTS